MGKTKRDRSSSAPTARRVRAGPPAWLHNFFRDASFSRSPIPMEFFRSRIFPRTSHKLYPPLAEAGGPAEKWGCVGAVRPGGWIRMATVKTKRVYAPRAASDGTRILVMRFWPRGIRKEHFDEWNRDVAPPKELVFAFKREGLPWREYVKRYRASIQ